ncbi:replication-associated recombination protein A [Aciditerrimonas ferrireducens]|uniref:replication-associated recombination protein A n=1 Tax=Aciditerrimonas ferrireducens TaxID=667306 RepID=UPI0020055A3C|nr:replication-associated recombination protein A [Aciditerrimonas ferrireducens]MCK4177205.1 replication-associated recombination protein A [Aciditerrimonas ferrireducens]
MARHQGRDRTAGPSLFQAAARARQEAQAPLAARLRPRSFDQVVGQRHLVAPDAPFRRLVEADRLGSAILFGPPGTGKTTLAELVARVSGRAFVRVPAVSSGVAEIRAALAEAEERLGTEGVGTILFVDEVHRFSRSQQDALLPAIEEGQVWLLAATTVNPGFAVVPPLRSRCSLWTLEPLSAEDLGVLAERALGVLRATAEPAVLAAAVAGADGDARALLGTLERAAALARPEGRIGPTELAQAQGGRLLHQGDDAHYDQASAFIKSLRGSDPDAACYWLARMLEAGEDPRFLARRMLILASEDVGLADPQALVVAQAAAAASELVGLPEAALLLTEAALYLALAPKSNRVTEALARARRAVLEGPTAVVPRHLRDAHGPATGELGHGEGYRSPHQDPAAALRQAHRPEGLEGQVLYEPSGQGFEAELARRLAAWRAERRAAREERGILDPCPAPTQPTGTPRPRRADERDGPGPGGGERLAGPGVGPGGPAGPPGS